MESLPDIIKEVDIYQLPYVRVTGVGSFSRCPRLWVTRTFELLGESLEVNRYAAIGTGVHAVCEVYLKGGTEAEILTATQELCDTTQISLAELENLKRYLETLTPWRDAVIVVEDEFETHLPGFGLTVRGHRDVVFKTSDGILILDHKTNRRYADVEWWSQQFQPLLYSYDARQRWGGNVHYQIGYVNLGTTVSWLTTPAADDYVVGRLQQIWEDMTACQAQGEFPERFGEDCMYCPLKPTCATFQNSISMLMGSFLDSVADQPLAARYMFARDVRLAAGKLEDDLHQQMVVAIEEAGGALVHDGRRAALRYGTKRQVKASTLRDAVELYQFSGEELDELISVKVGGVDKIKKLRPDLAQSLDDCVEQVPNASPTIVVKTLDNTLPAPIVGQEALPIEWLPK